jgi:hypothetical protein
MTPATAPRIPAPAPAPAPSPNAPDNPTGRTLAFLSANDGSGSVGITSAQGSSFLPVLARSYRNDTAYVRNIRFAVSATQVKAIGPLNWPSDFCGVQWVVRIDNVPTYYDFVFNTADRPVTAVALNGSASADFTLAPGATASVELVGFVVAHGITALCAWQSTAMAVTVK